ncbi:MAG: hypothetical protein NPINA01_32560 [Nitrospinaceae bacterium]|nr:MAG: hypothetical protein NPINA01_32560 [Nitrospinaceae bacterium]
MILGLDDIPGGVVFVSFLIWLCLSGLFYLVCYQAALNVLDDITRNSIAKIPVMWAAAVPSAGLMAVLNYKPLILFFIMAVANFFRIKSLDKPGRKLSGLQLNQPLFYFASYSYLLLMLALAFYFQSEEFRVMLST